LPKAFSPALFACLLCFLSLTTKAQTESDIHLRLETRGHTATISKLLITPQSQIVTASADKTIRIWDINGGRLEEARKILGQIGATFGEVNAIAISPDGGLLASGGFFNQPGGRDIGRIRLHDFKTGEIVGVLKDHQNVVLDLAFSPDGKWLASASYDGTVRIWSTKDGYSSKPAYVLSEHSAAVFAVRWLPDSQHLVSGSFDQTVKLWDLQKIAGPLSNSVSTAKHDNRVDSLAVGPDWIASASDDYTIRLWDFNLNPIRAIRSETHPAGLATHPNGKWLLTGQASQPSQVNVWNTETGTLLYSYKGHENLTKAIGWLDDQTAISAGGRNHEIDLWRIGFGSESPQRISRSVGIGERIPAIGLHGESEKTLAYLKKNLSPIDYFFDLSGLSNQGFSITDINKFEGLPTNFKALSLSHQKGGAYGFEDAVLVIRENEDVKARIVLGAANGFTHRVYGFTPEGLIVSGGANGQLRVYDSNGVEIVRLVGHEGEIRALAIDGKRLLSGATDQTLRVWNLEDVSGTVQPGVSAFIGFNRSNNLLIPTQWIAWTPSGYFSSSPNSERLIGFHVNRGEDRAAEFYAGSRFLKDLYRPKLIKLAYEFGREDFAISEFEKNSGRTLMKTPELLNPE